jgi:site-specific DNA-methyltransferase (adenine-specific)
MKSQVIQGNNADVLRTFPDNHFDSIVTDPPYGIDFLGKAWDATTGALETYQECLRVLKPGGHILAFSAARTYHHLAVTIEQAGFEIRDQIMWIYSSGFPKSQDISGSIKRSKHLDKSQAEQWSGWGTQLKPAHEPICLARKPIKLSIAGNCQQWGVGALNIDATRIAATDLKPGVMGTTAHDNYNAEKNAEVGLREGEQLDWTPSDLGRFPSNVVGEIAEPYQKYFYCPKVGRAERHIGYEMPPPMFGNSKGAYDDNGERYAVGLDARTDANKGNNHPTVKPIDLMKYLIRLVTPAGGRVLDPFNGSGSTGCAAVELDYDYTGIELDPAYVAIAERRIAAWYQSTHATTFTQLFTDA